MATMQVNKYKAEVPILLSQKILQFKELNLINSHEMIGLSLGPNFLINIKKVAK